MISLVILYIPRCEIDHEKRATSLLRQITKEMDQKG